MIEFHNTKMGRIFLEGTIPRIADALEKFVSLADQFMKETEETEKGDDVSQFKDPHVILDIPDETFTHEEVDAGPLGMRVDVELEGEGVHIRVFKGEQVVASVWKLYDEMASGKKAHNESA